MTRSRLATLAGKLPRALRHADAPSRVAARSPRSRGAPWAGERRESVTMDAAASNTTLVNRIAARIDRVFTRAVASPSVMFPPGPLAAASGWDVAMAPPQSNLILAGPDAPAAATLASAVEPVAQVFRRDIDPPSAAPSAMTSAGRSRSIASQASLTNWDRPIAAPEPALVLSAPAGAAAAITASRPRISTQPVRHETLARPHHAIQFDAPLARAFSATPPTSPSDAHLETESAASTDMAKSAHRDLAGLPAADTDQADTRPEPFQPFARPRLDPRAPRAAAGTGGSGAPWTVARAGVDQIEFAEFLRRALIDDARRNGIDV